MRFIYSFIYDTKFKKTYSGLVLEFWTSPKVVDWAFNEFQKKLFKEQPQTTLITISDQGVYQNQNLNSKNPDYKSLKHIMRIPFIISLKDLPKEIQGSTITHLTSNTDVSPTLLNLLGLNDISQQFLGYDAFSRVEPIFTNWFEQLLILKEDNNNVTIEKIYPELTKIFASIGFNNMLAPPIEALFKNKTNIE